MVTPMGKNGPIPAEAAQRPATMRDAHLAAVPALPTPLKVERKPDARSSYLLQGPAGRNVALLWSAGEAEEMAKRANAYPQLVSALRLLVGKWNAGEPIGSHDHLMGAADRILRELGEA